jgi:hypothetical protein
MWTIVHGFKQTVPIYESKNRYFTFVFFMLKIFNGQFITFIIVITKLVFFIYKIGVKKKEVVKTLFFML